MTPFFVYNKFTTNKPNKKGCQTAFSPEKNRFQKQYTLKCPHCSHALVHKKDRKHFIVHKCVNPKCSYYLHNLSKVKPGKQKNEYKQMIERLNRTCKMSYRPTNGFDSYDGANYDLALWVAYYNFLRPHKHNKYQVLNKVEMLENASNMPAKWQMLIFLGQQTILQLQKAEQPDCS